MNFLYCLANVGGGSFAYTEPNREQRNHLRAKQTYRSRFTANDQNEEKLHIIISFSLEFVSYAFCCILFGGIAAHVQSFL